MGIRNSKRDAIEEYEEYRYNNWPPSPADERQGSIIPATSASLAATIVTVGAAFIAANVGLALVLAPSRPKLEDDPMCGRTMGGEVGLSTTL